MWNRNYRAMTTEKLARCVAELQAGQGPAYQRCIEKGADPEVHLGVARYQLRQRQQQRPVS